MIKLFRKFCIWLVWEGPPLGRLAPHIFHLGLPGKVTMKRKK